MPTMSMPGLERPVYDRLKYERFSSERFGSERMQLDRSPFTGTTIELSGICDEDTPAPTSSVFRSFQGILLALMSSVFFSLTSVIVAYFKPISAGQMCCFVFIGTLLFTIPMVITMNLNPFGPKGKRIFLFMRGITGATTLFMRFSALHYMPIANETIIIQSMPVFVCIFGRIFLKEQCGIFHVVTISISLLGIAVTAKLNMLLGFGNDQSAQEMHDNLIGLAFSLGATIVGSTVYIFLRKVKECHSSIVLFNYGVVGIVESAILTWAVNSEIPFYQLPPLESYIPWLLMAVGTLFFYGQFLVTKALQMEDASLISMTRVSGEMTGAFIFQIIIFKKIPDIYAIIGAILVTFSVVLTSARKWVTTLRSDHVARKYLAFTLK